MLRTASSVLCKGVRRCVSLAFASWDQPHEFLKLDSQIGAPLTVGSVAWAVRTRDLFQVRRARVPIPPTPPYDTWQTVGELVT